MGVWVCGYVGVVPSANRFHLGPPRMYASTKPIPLQQGQSQAKTNELTLTSTVSAGILKSKSYPANHESTSSTHHVLGSDQ